MMIAKCPHCDVRLDDVLALECGEVGRKEISMTCPACERRVYVRWEWGGDPGYVPVLTLLPDAPDTRRINVGDDLVVEEPAPAPDTPPLRCVTCGEILRERGGDLSATCEGCGSVHSLQWERLSDRPSYFSPQIVHVRLREEVEVTRVFSPDMPALTLAPPYPFQILMSDGRGHEATMRFDEETGCLDVTGDLTEGATVFLSEVGRLMRDDARLTRDVRIMREALCAIARVRRDDFVSEVNETHAAISWAQWSRRLASLALGLLSAPGRDTPPRSPSEEDEREVRAMCEMIPSRVPPLVEDRIRLTGDDLGGDEPTGA